jgi:asparagine N-glycosylation enzyme membrane subunit Stt3
MRSFRFPRFTIFLMLACFVTLLAAIGLAAEMSRTVQMTYPGAPNLQPMWWAELPGLFAMVFLMLWTAGAVGYAILFVFRRSGLHRLSTLGSRPRVQ